MQQKSCRKHQIYLYSHHNRLDAKFEISYKVTWFTLGEDPSTDDWMVFPLDLDGPYLNEISEERFNILRNYLLKSCDRKMLWVTKSSQLTCEDPRFGLVFGLAQTLRQERMFDISTFETDAFDEKAVDGLSRVPGS